MADTGAYFVPWARKYHPSHSKVCFVRAMRVGIDFQAEDPAAIKQTWEYCEEQVRKVTGK
jgi:retinol dehydrogenase-12